MPVVFVGVPGEMVCSEATPPRHCFRPRQRPRDSMAMLRIGLRAALRVRGNRYRPAAGAKGRGSAPPLLAGADAEFHPVAVAITAVRQPLIAHAAPLVQRLPNIAPAYGVAFDLP